MELRNALSTRMGLQLPATIVFDHPSAAALAHHLASTIAVAAAESAGSSDVPIAAGAEIMPASLLAAASQQPQRRRLVGIAAQSAMLPSGGSAHVMPTDAPSGRLLQASASQL